MTPLCINANLLSDPWPDANKLAEQFPTVPGITRIGRVPGGTVGGKSSVYFLIENPDGSRFLCQTTLALLSMAANVLVAAAQRDGEDQV